MFASFVDALGPAIRRRRVLRGPAACSRAGMAFLDMEEATVRYRVAGRGETTIVFAADPPVVIEQYDDLISLLEADFRIIVFELPGFGFSLPKIGIDFDFEPGCNFVQRFLLRLNLAPCVLAFPCAAAYTAIGLASRTPGLVSHLVLIQAPSWTEALKWKAARDPKGILSTPVLGQLALQMMKRKRAPEWFRLVVGNADRVDQFVENADWAFRNGACFCLASAFQRNLTEAAPALPPVRQPTLIVWGENDRSHARTDKSSTRVHAPRAKEIRIEGAGHFPELEAPERFARAARAFLTTGNADSGG